MKTKPVSKRAKGRVPGDTAGNQSAPGPKTSSIVVSAARSFPVVGIGASAGGYESFTKFLEKLPLD
ncbi:MAG TPA: hypothetical protein VFR76_09445, partial [Verrucomicrobiae bacterium]|nr:hypothetical protein [Verrucomicrobiae bacterium]